MGDSYFINCEACEWKSGDFRSGHLVISAEGWMEEERELGEFREENVLLVGLYASGLRS